jgi:starch synthase
MNILYLSSEVYPYSKTGGLADVAGSLPKALDRLGHKVTVVTPFYSGINSDTHVLARRLRTVEVPLGESVERVGLYEGRLAASGARVLLLDHPASFARPGLYGEGSNDYADNPRRFGLFCRAAMELPSALGFRPDIVHANDWTTALALYYLKRTCRDDAHVGRARAVLTVHNLAYQGNFERRWVDELDLDWSDFSMAGFEFWGNFSFLKAGLSVADLITTVSQRYAREILTPEHGHRMEGVLQAHAQRLVGITDGIDNGTWSPGIDRRLAATYTADRLDGKAACKAALQKRVGLALRPGTPLFCTTSRITAQKGFGLLADALPELLAMDLQVVVLGQGDAELEGRLRELSGRHPGRLTVLTVHDETLAHQVMAGSDFCLVPSLSEPCGTTQLHAMRYGTLPVVHRVGGLDDTVIDIDPVTGTGTGFKFSPGSVEALVAAVRRALSCHAQPALMEKLIRNAMSEDFSWAQTAARYDTAYKRLLAG